MHIRLILSAFSAASLALGAALRATRREVPSDTVTCGSNQYGGSAIQAAIDAGSQDIDTGYHPGWQNSPYGTTPASRG